MTRQQVTHPNVLQIFDPNVVTTRQLSLDPMCCSKFCDNPSSCSGSNLCPEICYDDLCDRPSAQFCDRSLNSTFHPNCSNCRTNCCPLCLVRFAVSRHQLTTHTSSAYPALEHCLRALDWTVLEQVASVAPVVPLVPMQGQSTNPCSSRSTTSLRQSSCQCDPNMYPSILRHRNQFVRLACRRAPPFRDIRSSLSCRGVYPFLCSCSCLCPCQTLALSCLPLPLPVLGLPLPLSSVPDHPLVCLFCKYSVLFRQSLAICS